MKKVIIGSLMILSIVLMIATPTILYISMSQGVDNKTFVIIAFVLVLIMSGIVMTLSILTKSKR